MPVGDLGGHGCSSQLTDPTPTLSSPRVPRSVSAWEAALLSMKKHFECFTPSPPTHTALSEVELEMRNVVNEDGRESKPKLWSCLQVERDRGERAEFRGHHLAWR